MVQAEAVADPGVGQLVAQQIVEAEIEKLRATLQTATPFAESVVPESSDVAGMIEGGKMGMTAAMGGKPVPKEKVTIYKTLDGEPCQVHVYMLAKYLTRKHENGKPVWSLIPTVEYARGKVLCFLNEAHPNRLLLDSLGLTNRTCPAAHIASDFDARLHAEHRHPQSWRVWLEHKDALKEQEERLRWDALLSATTGKTISSTGDHTIFACPDEECPRFFDSEQGLRIHQSKEHKS